MAFKTLFAVIGALLLISSVTYGQMSFGDTDLERYKGGGSRFVREEQPSTNNERPTGETNSTNKREDRIKDQDYWCEKATAAADRVSAAAINSMNTNSTARSVASTYGDRYSGSQAVANAHIAADAADRELAEAKAAQKRLEDEAHRKGVPSGWLKCNFN